LRKGKNSETNKTGILKQNIGSGMAIYGRFKIGD